HPAALDARGRDLRAHRRQDAAAARGRLPRLRRHALRDLRERQQAGRALCHHHQARHGLRERMMPLIVRDATMEDAADILAIYNFAALTTTGVGTAGAPDLQSRRDWIFARQQAGFPVLVAMYGATVVGFPSFGDFRPWPGYRHPGENSVYVDERPHRL